MKKVTQTSSRKSEHIRINLEKDVTSSLSTGLERFRFNHRALPEINLEDVNLKTTLFKRTLKAPLLISCMTGGVEEAIKINQRLAAAAQMEGVAMGVGSQRAALEDPALVKTFQVRQFAPDILLLANLGAVQLNYGYGIDQCKQAVDMIEADALVLHFNALQEAVQPEGNTRFAGLLSKIESICKQLPVPVIAKEVGWGISGESARQLAEAGIAAIDVAGAGGTSWTQVEKYRADNENTAHLAAAFIDWGIPTTDSIRQVKATAPGLPIIASGGLRSGIDIAKCIALGATLGGMAGPFLKAADHSSEKVVQSIREIKREIQVCLFAAGIPNVNRLSEADLIEL